MHKFTPDSVKSLMSQLEDSTNTLHIWTYDGSKCSLCTNLFLQPQSPCSLLIQAQDFKFDHTICPEKLTTVPDAPGIYTPPFLKITCLRGLATRNMLFCCLVFNAKIGFIQEER